VDAGLTLLVDGPDVVVEAERQGIAIWGTTPEPPGEGA
jgi:hypothetical protein